MERKDIITGLERCSEDKFLLDMYSCMTCPYHLKFDRCRVQLMRDALAELKRLDKDVAK